MKAENCAQRQWSKRRLGGNAPMVFQWLDGAVIGIAGPLVGGSPAR
jgi:hypothetical protein